MHVLERDNSSIDKQQLCRLEHGSAYETRIKKPAEGAAGKDHFKKWRERKTEIHYRSALFHSLGLLQLLTKLRNG